MNILSQSYLTIHSAIHFFQIYPERSLYNFSKSYPILRSTRAMCIVLAQPTTNVKLRTRSIGQQPGPELMSPPHQYKAFLSKPMAPWTSVAAYEFAAAQSIDPRTVTKEALHQCGNDFSSCPGPYPTPTCPEIHVGSYPSAIIS